MDIHAQQSTQSTDTPETIKLALVSAKSQTIREFLEYMAKREYVMCKGTDYEDIDGLTTTIYKPTLSDTTKLLAMYFQIDLIKVESERQTLLANIRSHV